MLRLSTKLGVTVNRSCKRSGRVPDGHPGLHPPVWTSSLRVVTVKFELLTLDLFVTVVEQQSIAAAAERVHMAASAISRRLSALEASLGLELFKRHSRGIELTDAGEVLLVHARAIQSQVSLAEAELVGFAHGDRGLVRLAANKSAIMGGLPAELARFLALYPLIRIELVEGISPWIVDAVTSGGAHLGIYAADSPAPDLSTRRYRNNELVIVVPRGHGLARNARLRFAQLIDSDFVCLETGSSTESLCRQAAATMGRELRVRIRIGSFETQLRLVASGLGLCIVPRHVFEQQPVQAGLVSIELDEPWRDRPLSLCLRAAPELPLAARLLLTFLTEPSRAAMAACSMSASLKSPPSS